MNRRQFDTSKIRITIEEEKDFTFIATLWDKETCLEVDREVYEFDSFGGAVDHALYLMFKYMVPDEEAK